jgi:ribosomal protein S18 acetylase RimI-like enzyme
MSNAPIVRPASTGDTHALRELALDNGMFQPDEMDDFDEMWSGYLDGSMEGHNWVVFDDGADGVTGAAYYAPEPFSDRMWNLYFLAVRPGGHRGGVGEALIRHVEDALRAAGEGVARVLIVETSSLAAYGQARSFYRKQGYDEEARIREFYGPDDHKIVFWKSLVRP